MEKKVLRRHKLDFPQPRIWVKIYFKDKRVLQRSSTIKIKVYNFAKRHWIDGSKINLRVVYKKDVENEGLYYDWEHFVLAWEAFTEEQFMKEVINDY